MGPRPRLLPRGLKWSLMAAAPVVLFFLSFAIGRYPIGAGELAAAVWRRILDPSPIADGRMATVLFNIRLPRVLAILTRLAVTGGTVFAQNVNGGASEFRRRLSDWLRGGPVD